jgi:GNAT superfamily N-acetyltransferase
MSGGPGNEDATQSRSVPCAWRWVRAQSTCKKSGLSGAARSSGGSPRQHRAGGKRAHRAPAHYAPDDYPPSREEAGTSPKAALASSLPTVTDDSWIIRLATPDDGAFLGDMLVEATNWSDEWRKKSRERIFAAPETAHYIAGWPCETDLGVVAEADGRPVGAAWLRFLPASDPGYGFVAADVPELTIGVAASWRGRGVGRALLRAVADEARSAGIERISLSVERKNYAQKLYLSEGYGIVDSSDAQSDTMVKDLTPRGSP